MSWRRRRTGPDWIPDARDGLCRVERVVLHELAALQRERGGSVPSALLYGRIADKVDLTPEEMQELLARWSGVHLP